jgi:choline dehydrogenase
MFTHPFDIRALRDGVRLLVKFVSTPAFADYGLTPAGPFLGVDLDDDAAVYEVLRDATSNNAHPVGTAAMSARGASYGVVDPDLKVKRVKGLRVVDASIMVGVQYANWYGARVDNWATSHIFRWGIHRHQCTQSQSGRQI